MKDRGCFQRARQDAALGKMVAANRVSHRLCLVCSTAFVTKTLPLSCVFHHIRD